MTINAIMTAQFTKSPTMSLQSARTIRRLLKNNVTISKACKEWLEKIHSELLEIAEDQNNQLTENKKLKEKSKKLENEFLKHSNAVYVYTFPTYYNFGVIGDPEYKWFKIGRTTDNVFHRVVDQNRQTSMPEDPMIVRIYYNSLEPIADIETKFHETLKAFNHKPSSAIHVKSGTEWFATTEEALDKIAELLGLSIEKLES
jgi:hypothetical protein